MDPAMLDAAVAARVCPGNRASTTLLMPELNAHRLGQLLALYEHRTFVEAVLFGINPFDQFGVELGKTLAGPIITAIESDGALPTESSASTRGLVAHVRALTADAQH
jgi:glucose-6-phosphate isomerase